MKFGVEKLQPSHEAKCNSIPSSLGVCVTSVTDGRMDGQTHRQNDI